MSIIKLPNGQYKLDIRPDGVKGKRIIKTFKLKVDAVRYQNDLLSGRLTTKAGTVSSDNRQLNQLIDLWYELHGRSLKSALDSKNRLLKLSEKLNNPVAKLLSSSDIAHYRKERINQGISEATVNRELITLKALFRELKRLAVIDYESDILTIRKLREPKTELTYLTAEQITILLDQVKQSTNTSLLPVVLICLSTGARWSEAEGLKPSNCINGGFQFVDTKNGSSRFVPVSEDIFTLVQRSAPFQSCYSAYRSAVDRCGFTFPSGQLAHILRHTFASHFIMKGGNVRTLQAILGHSSLQMTMRYTHLAPEYLEQAKQLSPLAGLSFFC